ncbi:ATP-binding protein [Crenobacter sp. SG2303]|uniref:ATP-binding protein n=1 Tax=Crenobacter oryzisoli TaxID=3056844 RepID=A0ABT7XNP6_9NEIS|nr:ATP-binding protein [Crenobacter sp. SG2303]MDN0075418.1 ATP-binding protein [Crenobacter sp. SG2303]
METSRHPEFYRASYIEQRIPQYQGNPLIEALPPSLDDEGLLEELFIMPEFAPEQRNWHIHERVQMVAQLANFMVPLPRHLQLAHCLDALMRQGYIGRIPRSAASHRVFAKLHEQYLQKASFPAKSGITAQLSSSLIGLSGMGKTTTIKRLLSRIPEVIHHPDYGIYQIPYLHIETPYDGASVKGLAHSIFRKVDLLLPEAAYTKEYGKGGRTGAETLMNHAARILHMHCVGLLVVDEIQNLENSPKSRQALMTLLVSASNELGVPILFIGTNKARHILSLDFRQARRSIGQGLNYWDRLQKGDEAHPNEWEDFVSILWRFQWVRHPVAESTFLTDLLYQYSQGIVDIAIKLFAACQVRAMHDDSETITGQLITDVAQRELAMVAPMINAVRRDDVNALQAYDDIAPLNLEYLLMKIEHSYAGRKTRGSAIRPDNELFVPTVAASLEAVGFESEVATTMAENVVLAKPANALDGVKKALAGATSGPKAKKLKSKKSQPSVTYPPGDYRNALQTTGNETVFQRLGSLGLLPDLDRVLDQ